jgi:hypothetical protein
MRHAISVLAHEAGHNCTTCVICGMLREWHVTCGMEMWRPTKAALAIHCPPTESSAPIMLPTRHVITLSCHMPIHGIAMWHVTTLLHSCVMQM